ncbi:SDR family NAD(P)-dependent oxidoreductase [Roseococcus sp. DSY-14]|uniref:SDR family NAD(P)-dependent oxidoreductase n=1 Tax=Roseococcus sp. DSY-14 TaxID=3369650 RepID=UPI00387B861F
MSRPVALVTGASRGIGRAAALALAARGFHVVATARTVGALEELDDAIRARTGDGATLLPLDLVKEAEQVDAIGPSLLERFGRLDALVHAAGLLPKLTPVAHIMPKDWADSLAVNVTACWRLIRSTDPLLRAAPAGRAVILTDARAGEPLAYWGLYGAAKAAQHHLAATWAQEVANTPLRVLLHDPGPTATYLRRVAMPGEDAATLRTAEAAGERIAELIGG